MFEDLTEHVCPVCKLAENSIEKKRTPSRGFFIKCPRCKNFIITWEALFATGGDQGPLPKLSAWIRNFNEKGTGIPEIYQESPEKIPGASLPDYSPREKQIILLQNIERKTRYPGKPVQIVPKYDIPLAWAEAKDEFLYYITSLIERGFLRRTDDVDKVLDDLTFFVAITANGWDYLEKQERHIQERTQAFVAMSFSGDLKPIWEGPIYNAIKKAGYKPYRVDAEAHSDRIDAKIISEIKNSRFVIADVTEQKRGVYFEAGFALGLGLTVIWCVREGDLENVHFDTRQYNHIVWEDLDDLENKLFDFIGAIIGKGKGA